MSDDLEVGDRVDYHPYYPPGTQPNAQRRRGTVTEVWRTAGGQHTRVGVQWDAIDASEGLSGVPSFYARYPSNRLEKASE